MKTDQTRVRDLLTQTITLMCKNGLEFCHDLRIEGLIAVTVDGTDIFVVHMDEKVTDRPSYAVGARYSDTTTGYHQRNSKTCSAASLDNNSSRPRNDCIFPVTVSLASDDSERFVSLSGPDDGQSVNSEPTAEIVVQHRRNGSFLAAVTEITDESVRSVTVADDGQSIKTEPIDEDFVTQHEHNGCFPVSVAAINENEKSASVAKDAQSLKTKPTVAESVVHCSNAGFVPATVAAINDENERSMSVGEVSQSIVTNSTVEESAVRYQQNTGFVPATVAAINESEKSVPVVEDVLCIKSEASVEDSEDDVVIVEPDVRPLYASSIPLPVVEGLDVGDDTSAKQKSVSLLSRKRKKLCRTAFSDVSGLDSFPSISSMSAGYDDPYDERHYWFGDTPCALESHDDESQTNFLEANDSQALMGGIIVPMNTLTSRVIRDALVQFVVSPLVFKAGRNAVAFRVTWRHSDPTELDKAWLDVHHRRLTCDDVVRQHPNVDFFFSCITGLFKKSCSRTVASAFGVLPSISYYVVGDVYHHTLLASMRNSLFGGEIKLITARTTSSATDNLFSLTAPLYIVLKDHSSKYIKQRLIQSWEAANDSADLENSVLSLPVAKLVVVNWKLRQIVNNAYDELKMAAPSFLVHLDCSS